MCFKWREKSLQRAFFSVLIFAAGGNILTVSAQTKDILQPTKEKQVSVVLSKKTNAETITEKPLVVSVLPNFYDAQTGLSGLDLISRALAANGELVAARLDIEKSRAKAI